MLLARWAVLTFGLLCGAGLHAQSRPAVLLVTAHPDDWEAIAGGTVLRLRDSFDVHVAIASRGERGIKPDSVAWADAAPSAQTARIREAEAQVAARMVGATLYFLGSVDGDVLPDRTRVDSLTALMARLRPRIIITTWGADVPDHAAAGHMALQAAWATGLVHSSEFYYGEAEHGGQTQEFVPDFYVDVTSVADEKRALLRAHVCQNPDDALVETVLGANAFHGQLARCDFAEPFKTYKPLADAHHGTPTRYTLLALASPEARAAADSASAERPTLLVVGAHPGDWEDGCGGTVLRLAPTHDVHLVCVTRGERGAGGDTPEVTGPARAAEAARAAAEIGATLYFLGEPDAAAHAGAAAADSLAGIVGAVDPDVVLTMWPLDVPDHAAASQLTTQALWRTGHLHSAEVYFYESDAGTQTVGFAPRLYVDVGEVVERKRALLRLHATENPGDVLDANMMAKARFRGESARSEFAEGFVPYYPLIGERWGRATGPSLLELR